MQLDRREVVFLTGTSISLITAGTTWLWGPIPLIVIGVILLVLALFVDF